jgi:hypothetical protein
VKDVVRTCSKFEPDAVPCEDHPLGGPKGSDKREGYGWLGRAKTASASAVSVREGLRHRAADAENENKPREGFDEYHLAKHSTSPSCHPREGIAGLV